MKPTCDISQKIWLDEQEAIAYTTLSRSDLFNARQEARLSYYRRKGNRKIIYKRTDLDKFIESEFILHRESFEHITSGK